MRIARWGRRAISERGALSLSQEDRSALAQVANNGRVCRADPAFESGGAVFGREASSLHDVFCAEGDVVELAMSDWLFRLHLDPGVDGGIHRANTIETRLQRRLALFKGSTQPLRQ